MSLLRSAGLVFTLDDYPSLSKFLQTNLPTWHEVIRRILTITSENGKQIDFKAVCAQVAKELEEIWVSHTVYSVSYKTVKKHILKKYSKFQVLRHTFSGVKKILLEKEDGRSVSEKNKVAKWQNEYKQFFDSLSELCDLKTEDKARIKVQENVYGVKMTQDEINYYEKQKEKDRRWVCDKTVDPKNS